MILCKNDGEMITNISVINVMGNGKFEVWFKGSDEPIYVKISDVSTIS